MLELKNVRKVYTTKAGDVAALDGVSLLFPEKGMVFVTGKSGSGKTTLLNIIGGLDGIDEGEIEVFGKKFSEFTASEYDSYRNTLIGFIFQEYNLLPDYNIEKNVGIANELQGEQTDPEAVKDILASVDITSYKGRTPNQLSGGQKQRVAIARALIKNPKIIMADEPTGALDSNTGVQVIEELKRLSKEKLVIVISHDLELANKYADRIIRLVDGKVVEDVTVDEIEVDRNVYEEENLLTVKSGSDLNADETKALVKAIKEKKKVKFTDNFKIKSKKPTDVDSITRPNESVKFIKSKMKFKSAAMLGIKSLKVKPLRLIFTILLSAIAFAVFGVFDTVASYSRAKSISDLLQSGKYENLMVRAEYESATGAVFNMNMSEEYIEKLNVESGYDFRPVYNVSDFVSSSYSVVKEDNDYRIANSGNTVLNINMVGKGYYYPEIGGVIEFKNNELDPMGNIIPYGYYTICGRYPKLSGTEGSTPGYTEIAISKYMAETILHCLKVHSNFFGSEKVNTIEDLKDKVIKPSQVGLMVGKPFKIVGIYNCGEIPEDYEFLKDAYVKDKNDPNKAIIEELDAYLSSGVQKLIMVAEGEIAKSIKDIGKPVAYLNEPSTYYVDDNSSGFKNIMVDRFFCQDSVNANSVVMFDTLFPYGEDADGNDLYKSTDTYTLADNEVLIAVTDFRLLLENELSLHDTSFPEATGDFANPVSKLRNFLNLIDTYGNQGNEKELRKNLALAFNVSNTYLTPACGVITNPGLYRDIVLEQEVTATKQIYVNNLKVVGVYFGVQPANPDNEYEPIVFNRKTLENMGINTEQGYYPMATSLINTNKKACNAIASRLVQEEGVTLVWYGSTIMSTLSLNETWVSQFTNLFLYASLVLALFSMFMLFNYISASITSKRQSIGVLRALGSGSSDVFKMFITESIIIALINGVFACITAWIACTLVNSYLVNVMRFVVNFALFGIRQVFVIYGISILAAIASSIMPIIKIAREKPVDLIRRP